uniref:DnaD-like helicase loader n=1 Tax=Mycolicibacterium phage phi1_186018 TaxID=3236641 RepID=A0AB39AKL4_9CAUD
MMCAGAGTPTQRGYNGQVICGTCGQRVKGKNGLALEHPSKKAYDPTGSGLAVYFIADGTGHVKIGVSNDVPARMAQLQTGNPTKLRLLAVCPGGEPLEQALHLQFADDRAEGEWFRLTPAISDVIATLQAGNLLLTYPP